MLEPIERREAPERDVVFTMRKENGQPKRRSIGRPVKNVVGEEHILAAALELLQTTHPAQVNRLDIARAAGVDPGLIRYYFGTKDDLLARAIVHITQEAIRGVSRLESTTGTARERLELAVHDFFRSITTHPNYHQLILQQIYNGNTQEARDLRLQLQSAGQRSLRSIIDQGIAEGEFRNVDTRYLEIALIGMCSYIVTAWPLFEGMFDPAVDRSAHVERYLAFITDMIFALVSPLARPTNGRLPELAATPSA